MVRVLCDECGVELNKAPSRILENNYCNIHCYKTSRERVAWTDPNSKCSQYVDGSGRMRVWVPEHPRSYSDGYLLRNIVHWEYYNGQRIPDGYDVHHKDHDKLNDSQENLELISHADHAKLHNPVIWEECVCQQCDCIFKIKPWRLNEPGANRGSYCSQECYHESRRKPTR